MTPVRDQTGTLADPLCDLCHLTRQPIPPVRALAPADLPAPAQRLLTHESDMTSMLEAFHGQSVHLRVLHQQECGLALCRMVVLELDGTDHPVEFGTIRIHLQQFDAAARLDILAGSKPLGAILNEYNVAYQSRPVRFFRVDSNAQMNEAFGLAASATLYGRRNRLSDKSDRTLAEVVEILPPLRRDHYGIGHWA